MKKIAILALAGLTLAAPAFAESEFTAGAQRLTLDAEGVSSVDVEGIYMSYENSYTNGLDLNSDAFFGEDDAGGELLVSAIDASWKWRDTIGPKVVYSSVSTNFERESVTLGGLTLNRDFGALTLTGDVLSDIHNFGDQTLVLAGAEMDFGPNLSMTAEYGRAFNGIETETGALGVRYGFANGAFVSAKAGKSYLLEGVTARTAFIGGGLNF